jgi:CDP-diacylglycerol--glycerol-3-phosphate 3-phosphatidyltransferase
LKLIGREQVNLIRIRDSAAFFITSPFVKVLSRGRISPNVLTLIGLAINLGAAYFVATGHFFSGGGLILVSGLFDLLDGALARTAGRATKFGALLDSTVDRASEAAIFCGLLFWASARGLDATIVLASAVLIGSFLISYIRARAEGLGMKCKVGLFTRAERVIVLAVGLLLGQVHVALWILVVFIYVTVLQRLFYVQKQTGDESN